MVPTRLGWGAAIALASLSIPTPLQAAVQTPCRNGQPMGVHHAYSECQANQAGERVWFVVTDSYYTCPPRNAAVAFRTQETETAQPCNRPAPQQRSFVTELGPGDQSPQPDGEFIFMECVSGIWHRAHYQRHRLPDGSVRISRPAKRLETTNVPCDGPRPPLLPRATRAATAALTAQAHGGRQAGMLSGIVVASREDEQKRTTLAVAVPGRFGSELVDQVSVELPGRMAWRARATRLPSGWTIRREGKRLVFAGPSSAKGHPVALVIDLGRGNAAPEETNVEVFSHGRRVHSRTAKVQKLEAVKTVPPKQALRLPPALSAGQEVVFQPFEKAGLPQWGAWSISGLEPTRIPDVEPPAYRFTVPQDWAAGLELWVSYRDVWGEEWVRGMTDTSVIPPPHETPPDPKVTDATTRVLAGGSLCVCGWFPTPESRSGILMNGTPLGEPASSSPETLMFVLPPDAPAGPCELVGRPEAGFGPQDRARTTLIGVRGSIDRSQLLRGESTPLRLQVYGTEEPLTLTLRNYTPEVITIDGGAEQDVTTSGGAENSLVRSVKGHTPGDFNIVYELEGSACPCAVGSFPRASGGAASDAQ
jgi:hypothetical protein